MSADSTRATATRRVAIDHHHDLAPTFEANYERMAKSRFANSFTYGRHKVDVLLDRELKNLPTAATVLDVGCGTGAYLRRFHEFGFTPLGLEPAAAMIERARRDNPGVRIEEGVATALPFADQSVDLVSVIEVFRYLDLEDTRRGLTECLRVLKPGGVLFVTMVNRWALDGFYVLQRIRQLRLGQQYTREHPHCEFFTPREVVQELATAGFVEIQMIGRLFAPVRMLYKLNAELASRIARVAEPLDDLLHEARFTTPFAGHLIAIAKRPR